MIKEARPDARVAIFWHIPWPNAEAFGICPWQAELLDGLLAPTSWASTFNRIATTSWRPSIAFLKQGRIGSISAFGGVDTYRWCVLFPSAWPGTNTQRIQPRIEAIGLAFWTACSG